MPTTQAYFEGKFVPIQDAKVSIMSHVVNYGTGVFEGIRGYWNAEQEQLYLFRLQEHFERLRRSIRVMRIALPLSVDEMCDLTVELLRREGWREDVYVRPLAYKADTGIGVRLHNVRDDFALFATPFGKYIESEEGTRVCVSSWRRNDDNAIPARAKVTGAYVNSALIKSEAALSGFDEAIVLNQDGHVAEGSAENFFLVVGGVLVTPSITDNILEGITRQTVIQLAREQLGIETVERSIDRTELYLADEAFFCGTGVQIAAVDSIDNRRIGAGSPGPITRQLRECYFSAVRGQLPEYRHWCTPVFES